MQKHIHEWRFMGHAGTNGSIGIYWCCVCGTIKEEFYESDDEPNEVRPRMLKAE